MIRRSTWQLALLSCMTLATAGVSVASAGSTECPENSHWKEGYGCMCDEGYYPAEQRCEKVEPRNPDPGNPCRPQCFSFQLVF